MDLRVFRAVVVGLVLVVLPGLTGPSAVAAGVPGAAGAARAAAPSIAASAPGADPPMQPPLAAPVLLTPFTAPATRYGPGHRGVDLAAVAGDPVQAPAAGTVVFAGRLVDRGVVSLQLDDGLRTSLEPVAAAVTVGQRVTAGAVVGVVEPGHPRCAPAVCLHWGVRQDEVYLDPMALLARVEVRLLPWDL